jgi:hypothetical protein
MDAALVVLLMEADLAPTAEVLALQALTGLGLTPEDLLQGLTDHLLTNRTGNPRSLATAEKVCIVSNLHVPPMVVTQVTRMAATPICTMLEAPAITELLLCLNIVEALDLVVAALFHRPNRRTKECLAHLAISEVAAA